MGGRERRERGGEERKRERGKTEREREMKREIMNAYKRKNGERCKSHQLIQTQKRKEKREH